MLKHFPIIVFCILAYQSQLIDGTPSTSCQLKGSSVNGSKVFPKEFLFGVSTAAYQVEGGWNADGKGPSIWDTFTHEHPEMISDRSNADVGPDSYHKFDQDLTALKQLKVNFYRFSISWSRILPNGDVTVVNKAGLEYYSGMIDKLIANGIEPMVTMYHYDMPEGLSFLGGFTNEMFIRYFKSYAALLFRQFGDRVKYWITFNEPFDYCNPGYGTGTYPPMIIKPGLADYLCLDVTLRAHAVVYRMYRSKYFRRQQGQIGITISSRFYFQNNQQPPLLNRAMDYSLGWLGHPIFSSVGNYPPSVIKDILRNSLSEGRRWSRLKTINRKWTNIIKGSSDFLGLNYYTSRFVEEAVPPTGKQPSWEYDSGLKYSIDPAWRQAKSSWLYCVPEGLQKLLQWIADHYNNVKVIITENGWSDDGQLVDQPRIDYLKAHLQAVLNAIDAGCNVAGYTHWSLIDNFEWDRGYTEKFGLFAVNMTGERKERVPKSSAFYYQRVIATHSIPEI